MVSMFKLFWTNFKTTNNCIILATPLIIFLSIVGWYFNYAREYVSSIPQFILAVVTLLILSAGCSSAWFYMTKKTLTFAFQVYVFDIDRAKAFKKVIFSLPKGIGRLFLPFLGLIIIGGVIYIGIVYGITNIIQKCLGDIDIISILSQNLLVTSGTIVDGLNNLSEDELLIINCWYILLVGITTLLSFFTIFWIPEIVYGEKNPFKAFINNIKKISITFPKTLLLFVYISIISMLITALNTILMINPFLYFFVLLIYYYFIVYKVVLIFSYYEQIFISK